MLMLSYLSLGFGVALFLPLIFWPAGTWQWTQGWLYVGIILLNFLINFTYLWQVNRELIRYRMMLGAGTKRWDIIWAAVFGPLFVSIYVVAGFDAVRFVWSEMAAGWWWRGVVLHVAGAWLFGWSMGVNPFFEKTVRIQTERGHRVIDSGPYAFVRHPGYVGFMGWALAVPLLLGSWWAFLPALLAMIGMVVRTALEDMTLYEELEGYQAYSTRVRYRLVPGVW